MTQPDGKPVEFDPVVSAEALQKAEQYIEEEEGAVNRLPGFLGTMMTVLAVIMSLFHLYAAYGIMPTHVLRGIHVAFVLFLCFLLFPVAKKYRHRVCWWDWIAAIVSLVIVGNMLFGGDAFLERAISPSSLDQILGIALKELLIEKGVVTAAEVRKQIEHRDSITPANGSKVVALLNLNQREANQQSAPAVERGLFLVPKVIE